MQYFISFLEGVITFVSPCLLPMLPIYISYFAATQAEDGAGKNHIVLKNAMGFVLGFSIIFVSMGVFAGSIGMLLKQYSVIVNIITGAIVVLFGLNFIGILNFGFLNKLKQSSRQMKPLGFWSAALFGMVFSIGWTPCVSAFLGSALLLASQQGSIFEGMLMLLAYSAGLGIPFIVSAILIDKLKSTFDFVKKHYDVITKISGLFLIIVGILMMTGAMGYLLSLISF